MGQPLLFSLPLFLGVVAGHHLFSSSSLWWTKLSIAWSTCEGRILLGEEEEEGEKACISWSLVGVFLLPW